jgi:hypothetical protein
MVISLICTLGEISEMNYVELIKDENDKLILKILGLVFEKVFSQERQSEK